MNAPSVGEVEIIIDDIRKAEAAGDFGTAAILCSELIQIRPQDASLYLWLGWIYFNDSRFRMSLTCAAVFLESGADNKIDGLKLLAFSAARSGAWDNAKQAFRLLADISTEESIRIAQETLSTFWYYIHSKIKVGDHEAAVAAYENVPDVVRNLKVADRYDMDLIAAEAYAKLGKSYSVMRCFASNQITRAGDARAIPQRPFDGVTLVTSLMPARHELQQRAVASWHYAGAKIISFNAQREIDLLRDKYPSVMFVAATRDASHTFSKPYTYVSDMLSAVADDESDIVGIINSDIVIRTLSDEYLRAIKDEARYSLVFGHRYDVESIDDIISSSPRGGLFLDGYDYFLFARRNIPLFTDQPFVFGCPWWDIWLPIMASANNIDLCIASGRIAYHQKHEQRWTDSSFVKLGMDVVQELKKYDSSSDAGFCARRVAMYSRLCDGDVRNTIASVRVLMQLVEMVKSVIVESARLIKE